MKKPEPVAPAHLKNLLKSMADYDRNQQQQWDKEYKEEERKAKEPTKAYHDVRKKIIIPEIKKFYNHLLKAAPKDIEIHLSISDDIFSQWIAIGSELTDIYFCIDFNAKDSKVCIENSVDSQLAKPRKTIIKEYPLKAITPQLIQKRMLKTIKLLKKYGKQRLNVEI